MTRASATRRDSRNAAACHHLIRDTAVKMAHETYEVLMQRNDWYALWKSGHPNISSSERLEKIWVNAHWGEYIEGARTILAQSLAQPLPEVLKEEITEALILDNTLTRGRRSGQKLLGAL